MVTETSTWDVILLGSVAVRAQGRGEPIAGLPTRERALLAILALSGGRAVKADVLVEELWSGRPPDGARNTLQVYVSHLRRAMGRDVIISTSGGYRLCLGAGRVDAVDFVAAVQRGTTALREGDCVTAQAELSAALDRVHGRPLDDLTDYAFATAESSRLVELQATATEELAEAALTLEGGERLVLDRVWPTLGEHPFRERMRGAVMTALFRQGRAAEALRVYDEGRRLLRDELGLDPGGALQALQASILAQDPSLIAAHPRVNASGDLLPPRPLTSMFGRDGDVARVCASAPQKRLVTLIGPGGVGKTRLALECAHVMAMDPTWTVRWVELQDQPPTAGILHPVTSALGRAGAGLSVAELARSVAHEGPLLLVLDNVEHLLPNAAATIAELLGRSPNINIIATSRVALGVPGEQQHRLEGLSLLDRTDAADQILLGDALDMFVDHARRVSPGLEFTPDVMRGARHICVAVNGLPLAVQLAAARLSTMTLAELVAGLSAAPEAILSASISSLPMRHRSLTETLAWSEQILLPPAQRLFAWLSVFKGGFTIEAARSVCGGGPGNPRGIVAQMVEVLLEASLLERDRGATGRLGFVVAASDLAAQRLIEMGDEEEARSRHARYFADAVASRFASMPTIPRSVTEARWYDCEHHNIRAACETARQYGHDAELADLVTCSAGHWVEKGEWDLVSSLLAAVLQGSASPARRADAYWWLSCVAAETGSMADRVAHLVRGDEAAQRCGDVQRHVFLQAALASSYASAGEFDMARMHHTAAIDMLASIEDPITRSHVLVASAGAIRHEPESARQQLREGIEQAERAGIDIALVLALNNLADLCAGDGQIEEAIHWATLGLRHEMAAHDIGTRAYLAGTLGVALVLSGDRARARPAAVEAFRTGVAAGSQGLAGAAALLLSCLAAGVGRDHDSAVLFGWHDVRLRGLGDALQGPELLAYQRFILPLRLRLGHDRFEFLAHNGALLTEAEMAEWILWDREPVALELLF